MAQTLQGCFVAFFVCISLLLLIVCLFFIEIFASSSAHQKVLWSLVELQIWGILYFPYNNITILYFLYNDLRLPESSVENYAKQNLSACVWWVQFYLSFSIPGKNVEWIVVETNWLEQADCSSRVCAILPSHAAVCACILALPSGTKQKCTRNFLCSQCWHKRGCAF